MLGLLLNKTERIIIWNALWFSNHTYRRRGNTDGAVAIQMVMNNLKYILNVKNQKFAQKEEVKKIIDDAINIVAKSNSDIILKVANEQYKKGFKAGERNFENSLNDFLNDFSESFKPNETDIKLKIHAIIDHEICEKRENKKDCPISRMIFKDLEEDKKRVKETTETDNKVGTQAAKVSESCKKTSKSNTNAADDGVNYEEQ